MATKDWNGFKKNGDTYIPNDLVARDAVTAITDGTGINSFSDVETALEDKVNKVAGKGLSTNDYNNTAKGIVDTAQANINANTKLIKDTVGWSGKNKKPFGETKGTVHGLTFVDNSDGSFSVSGTANNTDNRGRATIVLDKGDYILSGVADGGSSKYELHLKIGSTDISNYGGDTPFTIPSDGTECIYEFIYRSGAVINTTVYPMIRDANILDPTFEPYFGSTAFPRSEQSVLGAKNFVIPDGESKTNNGVTFTVNSDGTVDVSTESGGATADTTLPFHANLQNGIRYKMTGCPANGAWNKYVMYIDGKSVGHIGDMSDLGSGAEFTITETKKVGVTLFIPNGSIITTPINFSPMIRLATDSDDTYAPYAMTNKELTGKGLYKKGFPPANTDLDTLMDNGIYHLAGIYTHASTQDGNMYGVLTVEKGFDESYAYIVQTFTRLSSDTVYVYKRFYASSTWSKWNSFTGTVLS